MRPHPIRPVTLAELRRSTCWVWLYCDSCGRGAPVAVAPWLIRYGPTASSDLLRENARCEALPQPWRIPTPAELGRSRRRHCAIPRRQPREALMRAAGGDRPGMRSTGAGMRGG